MEKLIYSKHHLWLKMENDIATIGISDYAQEKLGSILFVNLPDEGEKVVMGEKIGDIESVKTVSDLITPVDGVITSINEELIDEPDKINSDPYKSWLVEIKVENAPENLMNELTYKEFIGEL